MGEQVAVGQAKAEGVRGSVAETYKRAKRQEPFSSSSSQQYMIVYAFRLQDTGCCSCLNVSVLI